MPYRIDSIEVYYFKFFEKSFTLPIKRKNVLLFGENGSGKSSLFWSFYTHYQAVYKPQDKAQKYFLDTPESLCNKFTATGTHSGIRVTFKDENGSSQTVEDSDEKFSVNSAPVRSMMLDTASASDFFNYKFLSSIFNFKNSEENEIFKVFEKEIFQYLSLRHFLVVGGNIEGNDAKKWWQYINNVYKTLPRNRKNYNDFNQNAPEYKDFCSLINQFNDDLRYALTQLILAANQLLRNDFKIPVELTVRYQPVKFNERIPGTRRSRDRQVTPPKIILNAKMVHADIANPDVQRPSSFFNEAKLTCMALALRLAVLNGKPTEGVTYASSLFIDDLLVSLDMSYRRVVVELLLRFAENRQMLFFTHDRLLFHLVKEEINSSRKNHKWLYYELYTDIKANHPVPHLIIPTTPLEQAKAFLLEHRIPACANALRKACERELRRLLPLSKQVREDPQDLNAPVLLDLNGLICNFEKMRIAIGMPDLAHGLSADRQLILNPFSHDDVDTSFYHAELQRLITCCEHLKSIKKRPLVASSQVHHETGKIVVQNGAFQAEATFLYNEAMYLYELDGNGYYTLPKVRVLTCAADTSIENKEREINALYRVLFNSVSLNATTCPDLKDVLYKLDGTLLIV